ncbi:MAG TPA: 7TM diverse intracellular signaling domain-containing protein [Chitinophagaceae bacterium]
MRKLLLLLALGFACTHVFADTLRISKTGQPVLVGPYLGLLEENTRHFDIRELIGGIAPFHPAASDVPVFAHRDAYVWARFTLANSSGRNLWLEVENPTTDTILFYAVTGRKITSRLSGDKVSFDNREIHSNKILFNLGNSSEPTDIYLRLNIRLPRQFPLSIISADAFLQDGSTGFFIDGLFYGLIGVIVFYNLFLWTSLRDRFYLYYIGYILFSGLLLMHFDGITYAYLWPSQPWINDHPAIIASIPIYFALLFVSAFLNLRHYSPKARTGLWVIAAMLTIGNILSIAEQKFLALTFTQSTAFISALYFIIPGVVVFRKGYKPARYYLAAWIFLVVAVLVFLGKDMALLPYTTLTAHSLKLGIAAEAVLMAFALADRISFFRSEKRRLEKEKLGETEQRLRAETELKEAGKLLADYTDNLRQKNALIEQFREQMAQLEQKLQRSGIAEHNPDYMQQLMDSIILTDEDWRAFRQLFDKVHSGYIYRIREKYTGLTESDVRLLTLMKLRLTQQEMANMLGVSQDAVRKAKQRLKKKLNMPAEEYLEDLVGTI